MGFEEEKEKKHKNCDLCGWEKGLKCGKQIAVNQVHAWGEVALSTWGRELHV